MRFVIFSSNQCNLTCPYCAVAVNKFDASSLSHRQVCRGIDLFLERYPGREHKIIFLGGEPFIYFKDLVRIIDYIRKRRPGGAPGIDLYTNGTLMTQEKVDALKAAGVELYLSLDGRRETNDANRMFFKRPGASVFDKVMENIGAVKWSPRRVNMVLHDRTVTGLVGNVHLFYRLGFSEINFQPDIYEVWSPERLGVLAKSLREFGFYYEQLFRKGGRVFELPILHFVLERLVRRPTQSRWWEEPEDVVLGRDGFFYPCPTSSTFHPKDVRRYRVGSLRSGLSWARWQSFKDRVRAYILDHGHEYDDFYHTPEEMFLYGEASPLGVAAVFDNEIRVSRVLRREFSRLAGRLRSDGRFRRIYLDKDMSPEERAAAGVA